MSYNCTMTNRVLPSHDEIVDTLARSLAAFCFDNNTECDSDLQNGDSDMTMADDTVLPKTIKKRPYKSIEDFLSSSYEYTENIRYLDQKNKDVSEYIIDNPKYQNYFKDCSTIRLTGSIDFREPVNFYMLSKMGYEIGERCVLQFIVIQRKENKEYVKTFKFYTNICFIELKDTFSTNIEATFEFEKCVGAPEDEDELKNLLCSTEVVKVSLDPENGIYFSSLNEMRTYLEPLWETPLGETLKMLLIDGYSYDYNVYDDSDKKGHWLATALGLNSGQEKALNLAEKRNPICFIHSPPGTGKTTTASSIIYANPQYKYVITAESNKGCDALANTIERMKKIEPIDSTFKYLYKCCVEKVCPVRIYSSTAKIRKKNQSNYCESKLKLSKNLIHSEKLTSNDCNVLAEYDRISRVIEQRKSRQLTFNELSKFRKSLATLEDKRSKIFMKAYDPNIFIMTTNYAVKYFKRNYGNCKEPSVVIVDEAGQMTLWSFILLAARFPNAQFILFGDTKQLPPYLPMDYVPKKKEETLTCSIIEYFNYINLIPKTELDTSYRMHPMLLSLVSYTFYENKLLCGVPETMRSIITNRLNMPNNCPFAWFDTKGCEHRMDMKTSTSNDMEAYFTSEFLKMLLLSGYKTSQIGVICMYRAQVSTVCKFISNKEITVDTVDAFQGNERDIIVICTSKTAKNTSDVCSNFLGDSRRINVAVSRARCGLFIFGDIEFLTKNDNWDAISKFFRVSRAVDTAYNMNLLFTNNSLPN